MQWSEKIKTEALTPKKHKTLKISDREALYSSPQWRNTRAKYHMEHPLCELCMVEDKITAGEHIHHIQKFNDQPSLNLKWTLLTDEDNLLTVCQDCHYLIHKYQKELTLKQRDYLSDRKKKLYEKYLLDGQVILLTNDSNVAPKS